MRNHKESGNRQQFVRMQGPAMEAMALETSATTSKSAIAATTAAAAVAAAAATIATTRISPIMATSMMPNALEANATKTLPVKVEPATIATTATVATSMLDNNNDNTNGNSNSISNSHSKTNNNNNINNNMATLQADKATKLMPLPHKSSTISAAKDNNGNQNSNSNNNALAYLPPRRHQFTPMSDASNASFSSASVAGSIQDDIHDQCGLTQAGLEEYNIRASSYYDQTFHHQKQASYAQSEGYHSYVSSSDSTSTTPFLDKLRQESDLLSRQSHHWSENDLSSVCSNSVAPSPIPLLSSLNGRDTNSLHHNHTSPINHNSSESTSSTETLKCLGSMSDVSEASHVTGYSAIAESVSSSQLIVHSSRVLTPKRHHSESVLYLHDNDTAPGDNVVATMIGKHASQNSDDGGNSSSGQPLAMRAQHRHSPSYPPVHTSMVLHHFQASHQPQSHKLTQLKRLDATQSSLPDIQHSNAESRLTLGQSQSTGDLQQQQQQLQQQQSQSQQRASQIQQQQQHKSSISVTISSSEAVVTIAPQPPPSKPQLSKTEAFSCSAPNVASVVETQSQPSNGNTDSYRSNHRLFPVSTYTEPVHNNTSQYVLHPKPQYSAGLPKSTKLPQTKLPVITPAGAAVQPTWHSVAERINDFERSSVGDLSTPPVTPPAQKYSYLEPSKTHRLSNPALKALQKNAVQSYFERQQHQQQQQKDILLTTAEQQLLRNHSYQSLHATRDSLEHHQQQQQALRKSLPNNLGPMLGIPTTASSPTQLTRLDCSLKPPVHAKPPSPAPPPPPPRSRSLLPNLLRRSSSASDYAEFRDQYQRASQDKLQQQAIKNVGSAEKQSFNDCGMPPPPPPPRGRVSLPTRRTSSASEYAPMREKMLLQHVAALAHQQHHPQQHAQVTRHAAYYQQPPPVVPATSNWVPERPPKNPNLRVPSPELPPPPTSNELDTSYTFDEPLPPPPPPEVLQPKPPPSPNRRNSFAGASTRRSNYTRNTSSPAEAQAPAHLPKVPPLVPKKPTTLLQSSRNSAQPQTNKVAHKLLLNGSNAKSTTPTKNITNSRKRPHNPPPIMEHSQLEKSGGSGGVFSPPPLLPRARPTADIVIANNLESNQQKRSNSKASYLPRQSLEKLNNTDPDHGIYKLTLTSNEDLVAHNKPSYELLPSVGGGGKLPNNLPDVLPLGVKLQQQPKPLPGQAGSPNGLVNEVPLRYGSNNNLATNSPTNATPYTMIYTTAAASASQHQRYSSPALSDYKRKTPFGHLQHYTRSQSYDLNQSAGIPNNNPTQFMSQSHVDLKQTAYDLETTLEEVLPVVSETPPRLSPAHSDCSLSSGGGGGGSSLDSSPASVEPHIFRAELISTTLSTPPKPTMNRQESLRENIEKITQLQSKLMSAHLCDSGILGGSYTSAKQANPTPLQPSTVEHMEKCLKDESAVSPGEFCEGAEPSNNKNEELSPPITPLLQMDASTDGLKLVQRSEIVLRVNPPSTCEIACQTEELPDFDLGRLSLHNNVRDEQQTRTTLQPRQRQTIEVEYDNLANELLQLLAPNDKLIEILTPKIYKPTTEYVSNLYNPNVPLRPTKRDVGTSTLMRMKTSTTSPTTAMSESKLITVELQLTDLDSVLLNGVCDPECTNLIKQKLDELIKQLNQKIAALKREKQTISEECGVNEKVGTDLLAKLTEKVRPSEASKFRTYIDDVGHITSLLLSLSERLAQTECNLESRAASGYSSEQEKITLEAKRDLLYEQLEEAKRLKADIDRRGSSIATLFGKHLSADECADYDYFINMKAKLIADARDLADKIKCSEEQLGALRDALVQSDC